MNDIPRVSIGLPVYNGSNFLEETLSAFINQDYQDLEIIISDNASDDSTEQICRAAAERDPRIRYYRQKSNIGAAPNYNFVFHEGRGEFFAWAAHDDRLGPGFISATVRLLDEHPEAVGAFSDVGEIDQNGATLDEFHKRPDLIIPSASARVAQIIDGRNTCYPIFSLFRTAVLEETRLHQSFTGSDRVLLVECVLRGTIVEAPEKLFFHRVHPDRSVMLSGKSKKRWSHAREAWFDPTRGDRIVFPAWRRLGGYLEAARSSPVSLGDRWACYWRAISNLAPRRFLGVRQLARDLVVAAVTLVERFSGRRSSE